MKSSYQIRVSKDAYAKLTELSREAEFKGKGITGVIDKVLFGRFTTKTAGRPRKTNKIKKSVDKLL